jgi:hypothetical protein
MNEIGIQFFQEAKASYIWVNRSCWASFIAIAGWCGSYAITKDVEIVGAWWEGGYQLARLVWFIIIFAIIAYIHNKQLASRNDERKKALAFLIENNLISEQIINYFSLSQDNFDSQYQSDKKWLLFALFAFLIIIAFTFILT